MKPALSAHGLSLDPRGEDTPLVGEPSPTTAPAARLFFRKRSKSPGGMILQFLDSRRARPYTKGNFSFDRVMTGAVD